MAFSSFPPRRVRSRRDQDRCHMRRGSDWTLNGRTMWITNRSFANVVSASPSFAPTRGRALDGIRASEVVCTRLVSGTRYGTTKTMSVATFAGGNSSDDQICFYGVNRRKCTHDPVPKHGEQPGCRPAGTSRLPEGASGIRPLHLEPPPDACQQQSEGGTTSCRARAPGRWPW
jgi:hypothetical protein